MKFVILTIAVVAALASTSIWAEESETLAQHAAAKHVKVGHLFHWNIQPRTPVHSGAAPAQKSSERVVRFEPGHVASFKARVMLKSQQEGHISFTDHSKRAPVTVFRGAAGP